MKYWVLVFLLLIPSISLSTVPLVILAGGAQAGGEGGDAACQGGTYMFAYNGDYTTDTDKACFTSATVTKDGTIVDSVVTADYVENTATNDYITWTVSSGDGFSSSQGTVFFSAYIVDEGNADVDENAFMEFYNDANNHLHCFTSDGSDLVGCIFTGDGTSNSVFAGSVIATDAWYRIGYSWQVGTGSAGQHSVSSVVLGNATSWTEAVEDLDDWNVANPPDDIKIGELNAGVGVNDAAVRVKDMVVLSGYQDTDPTP